MGKLPRPGRVKTRLGLPGEQAAALYRAFLLDALSTARSALAGRGPLVFACAVEDEAELDEARALVSTDVETRAQEGQDLGARMQHAWRLGGSTRTLVMGSDLPSLTASTLTAAWSALDAGTGRHAVFAPAVDGGYVLFGLSEPMPELFVDMRWSVSDVFDQTLQRALRAGIDVTALEAVSDCDEPSDLAELPGRVDPASHTAYALAQLSG